LVIALLVALIVALRGSRRLLAAGVGAALVVMSAPVAVGLAVTSEHNIAKTVPRAELSFIRIASDDPRLTLLLLPQYAPLEDELLVRWGRIATLVSTSPLAFDTLRQDD